MNGELPDGATNRADLPGAGTPGCTPPGAPPPHVMDPIERMVSRILAAGITVSVAFMAVGLVLGLVDKEGMPSHAVSFADLASLLRVFDPAAYLSLGLLLLIATPFVRVAGSIIAFARQRDRRYVLVTAVVFAVMCLGVVVGRA